MPRSTMIILKTNKWTKFCYLKTSTKSIKKSLSILEERQALVAKITRSENNQESFVGLSILNYNENGLEF